MRTAVIFDMDGTLADVRGIRHHIVPPSPMPKGWYKDFDAFHSDSVNCPANPSVVAHAHRASLLGNAVLVVTARRARYRNHTAMWLALNGVPSDRLYMRGDKDNRPDYLVKKDILDRIRTEFHVIHAVDDNPSVIALWQENGISTTVVEGWGF
jgi:phosphoglycolate phosphatase-like HAD superfamily hydrolase